jgi:hypothetical protein
MLFCGVHIEKKNETWPLKFASVKREYVHSFGDNIQWTVREEYSTQATYDPCRGSRYSVSHSTIAPVSFSGSSAPGPKWRVRTSEHQNQGQHIDSCFARATEYVVRTPYSIGTLSSCLNSKGPVLQSQKGVKKKPHVKPSPIRPSTLEPHHLFKE